MKKYRIEEVAPECSDLSYAFDDDGLTEAGTGDFCGNVFLFSLDRYKMRPVVINQDEAADVIRQAENVLDFFGDVLGWYSSYKEAMEDAGVKYSPKRCHDLKEWTAADPDPEDPEDLVAFLTITTGRTWDVALSCGYCQGDVVYSIFCPDFHDKEDVRALGEICLGAAREYTVTEYGDDGEELETVGWYIVADCQAWSDDDVKALVCEWAGIRPEETELRAIDGLSSQTVYEYRTA